MSFIKKSVANFGLVELIVSCKRVIFFIRLFSLCFKLVSFL